VSTVTGKKELSFQEVLTSHQATKVSKDDKLLYTAAQRSAEQRPHIPVSAQMPDHAMRLAGVSARDYYFDSDACVRTSAAVSLYYDFDALSLGTDAYNFEAEALGARMIYGKDSMPTIDFRDPLISPSARY